MSTSVKLSLPYLASGQSQKHVTVNEALTMLDALVQLSVISASNQTPPGAPQEGDRHIVPPNASGTWAGNEGSIAVWQGSWTYLSPREGWLAWVEDIAAFRLRVGANWIPPGGDVTRFKMIGVNTDADLTNRLSVKSSASLLSHDGADHRLVINKVGATATASLVFQTQFAGKAEIGTAGTDNLLFRTNGTAGWKDRLCIDTESGNIGVGTTTPAQPPAPGVSVHVHGQVAGNWASTRYTVGAASTATDGFLVGNLGGTAYVWNYAATPVLIGTNSAVRIAVTGSGLVGIGTSAPSCELHVEGLLRTTPRTLAQLPTAVASGAGALAYVSNATGGPALAFSDGTIWRRVHDQSVLN